MLTTTGTLTRRAAQTLFAMCDGAAPGWVSECQSAAQSRVGGFSAYPEEVSAEFAFLLGSCLRLRPNETCARRLELERAFRELTRGELHWTDKLSQGEYGDFRIWLEYDGNDAARRTPGRAINPAPPSPGGGNGGIPGEPRPIVVMPFSQQMCFTLSADPLDFKIDPPARKCPPLNSGGTVQYEESWRVKPLRSGTRGLKLSTEVLVDGELRPYPIKPYPLPIEIKPTPSFWDRIDAWLARATGTTNLATGLAKALGALFVVVAGWSIWALFRRSSARSRETQPPPAVSTNGPGAGGDPGAGKP